jgi:small-conductance mechanosensitive channel
MKMHLAAPVLIRRTALVFLLALFSAGASAQEARPAPSDGAKSTQDLKTQPIHADAYPVRLANRVVAIFRAPFLGVRQPDRVARTEQAIESALDRAGPGAVSVEKAPQGNIIMIDGSLAIILTEADTDPLTAETLDSATQNAVAALTRAIGETREARNHGRLLSGAAWSLAATAFLALLVWVVLKVRHALVARLALLIQDKAADVPIAGRLVQPSGIVRLSRWFVRTLCALIIVMAVYEWLSYVLTRFPYTRVWGEHLNAFVLGIVREIGGGILRALPDLIVAGLIFIIARYCVKLLEPAFDRAAHGRSALDWLDRDLARPTQRLISVGIWLFAIVMAYPYLPGSDSEAFKGISVLVGLMVTLGGSNLIGQGASGLILMYSRTLRVGEYVRIGDLEGTVSELGTFTTKIRTGMGEELSYPNALILGSVTKNYSRVAKDTGYVVDTVVTIGYDTPWRQVEAMLLEAASRTPGISDKYTPRVFQTALSDFYPEYRLVCYATATDPLPRAEVLHHLHANIQDVFNEFGVQIMSPHYLGDPQMEKVVPKDKWFAAPAKPADPGGRG